MAREWCCVLRGEVHSWCVRGQAGKLLRFPLRPFVATKLLRSEIRNKIVKDPLTLADG